MSVRRGGSDGSHPINDAGDPGGGRDPGEAGTPEQQGKRRKRAKFRRRISLPRPSLRRPRVPRPRLPRPQLRRPRLRRPKLSLPERPTFGPLKVPKPGGDLRFRLVTRLRAAGYWLREKGKAAWQWLTRGAEGVTVWWSRRSRATRAQIFAVAGVVVLYLIVKFISIPGIPCEVSAAKECAPSDGTIAYVPRDAALYLHVTVNGDSHQWELAEDLRDELPNLTALLQSDTSTLDAPAGRPFNLPEEVLPWVKDDLALVGVAGPKDTTPEAYVAGVGDSEKANAFLASLLPDGKSKQSQAGGATVTAYANGFATARSGDQALFGNVLAVRAALDAKAGRAPRLEGSPQDATREALPDVRLADLYLSRAGVQRLLAGRGGGASQLDTFVDYGATTGMAAGLRVRDDGVEIHLESRLDPKLVQRSPTVFAALPRFEPELADEAGDRALGYIGVGELGPALNKAIATAGAGAQGLTGSLRGLAQTLQQEVGVDPLEDLLPALGGQAALVAEPTEAVPYATLIVDGVDEKRANAALAALQRPVLRAFATGPQVPSFKDSDVDGVTVHSVQVSPNVNLSYAVFDGKLAISTQPQGIEQVRSAGDNLAESAAYEDATDRLPDRVSALVFLNLDEVFGLAQEAGLATDPLYASLSEDISRVGSLGLAVTGSDSQLRSELFLAIHH